MSADMRAAFEHWMSDGGESPNAVRRAKPDGEYALMQAAYAWTAWQAAWTTQRAEIERLTSMLDRCQADSARADKAWHERLERLTRECKSLRKGLTLFPLRAAILMWSKWFRDSGMRAQGAEFESSMMGVADALATSNPPGKEGERK